MNSAMKVIGALAAVGVVSLLILSLAMAQRHPDNPQVQTACHADQAQGCAQATAGQDSGQTTCCRGSGCAKDTACDPNQKTACCAQQTASQPK